MRLGGFFIFFLSTHLIFSQPANWKFSATDFQYSGSMISYLFIDGERQTEDRTLLIYSGNEVRGLGTPLAGSNGLYFITFHSNEIEGDTLNLMVYRPEDDQVFPVHETYYFKANMICGSIENPDLLHVYTDGDIPPKILPIPIQMAFIGQEFDYVLLNPYAEIYDQDSFYWVASDGEFLLPSIRGDTLSVTSRAGHSNQSDTLLLGLIESTPNHHADYIPLIFSYNNGNYDIQWKSIPGIAINQGDTFPTFDLDDYWTSQFSPNCLNFDYQIQTDFPEGYDTRPLLELQEADFIYNMSLTARVQFTEGLIFSHEDDLLMAYADNQLLGFSSPTLITGNSFHFLNIYSNTPNPKINFQFFSGLKKTLFHLSDSLNFQISSSIGQIENPFILETTPIEIQINENNEVQTTILDTAWLGYLNITFTLEDCQFPELINDTVHTYMSVGLTDECNDISTDFQSPSFIGHLDPTQETFFEQRGSFREIKFFEWSDSLTSIDNKIYNFKQWSCLRSFLPDSLELKNNLVFDTITLESNELSDYLFILSRDKNDEDPFLLALFEDSFDLDNPCRNLIGIQHENVLLSTFKGLGATSSQRYAPWLSEEKINIQLPHRLKENKKYVLLVGVSEGIPITKIPFSTYMVNGSGNQSAFAYFKFYTENISDILLEESINLSSGQYLTGGNNLDVANLLLEGNNNLFDQKWYRLGQKLLNPSDSNEIKWHSFISNTVTAPTVSLLQFHHGFKPMVIENCPNWWVDIYDTYFPSGDCILDDSTQPRTYIERKYIVRDQNPFTTPDTARVHLIFSNPDQSDIYLPPSVQLNQCGESPDTIFPYLYTLNGIVELSENKLFNSLAAQFEDGFYFNSCGDNQGFRREWTIFDFCKPGETLLYQQLIQSNDWIPPTFVEGHPHHKIILQPGACEATIELQRKMATDDCGSIYTGISVIDLASKNEVGYFPLLKESDSNFLDTVAIEGLSLGSYLIKYIAEDDCNNQSIELDTLIIQDFIKPTCLLKDNLQISIGQLDKDGLFWIPANLFDEGSSDNCGSIEIKGSRNGMDSWSTNLSFSCQDAGHTVSVPILIIGGSDSTECSTTVKIIDQFQPACPEKTFIEIPCSYHLKSSENWEFYFDSLSQQIIKDAGNICQSVKADILYSHSEINSCGMGSISRSLKIYNPTNPSFQADTCFIHLISQPTYLYEIDLKKTTDVDCKVELSESEIEYTSSNCDLMASSMSDQLFEGSGNLCAKVIRTTRIINWCEYNGSNQPWIIDTKADFLKISINYSLSHSYPDISFYPEYSNIDSSKMVFNIIEMDSESYILDTIEAYSFKEYAEKGRGFFQYTSYLNYKDTEPSILSLDLPEGESTYFTENLMDEEGNCVAKVRLTGSVKEACISNDPISISFSIPSAGITLERNISNENITLLDTQLTEGVYQYLIKTQDNCGNIWEQVDSFAIVDTLCKVPFNLEGKITTTEYRGIENVYISINQSLITHTDHKGKYSIHLDQRHSEESMKVEKNQDFMNGISTLDMIILRNHILELEIIENPFLLLAADTDGSGDISTRDMIEIRRLILTQIDSFEKGQSWIFLPEKFEFVDSISPLQQSFPKEYLINSGMKTIPFNWFGIKIGDLNHSALQDIEPRGMGSHLITLKSKIEGNYTIIHFYSSSKEYEKLTGLQMSISIGNLLLEEIIYDIISETEIYRTKDEKILVSHITDGQIHERPLFSIKIKNYEAINWEEEIALINFEFFQSEAYNQYFEKIPIKLEMESNVSSVILNQNYPNPFSKESVITIHSGKKTCGYMILSDWKGTELMKENICWDKGINLFQIPSQLIKNSGWYYFTFQSADRIQSIKLVKSK
jgi:hypothetical protein